MAASGQVLRVLSSSWSTHLSYEDDWALALKPRLAALDIVDLAGLLKHLRLAKVRPSDAWRAEIVRRLDDPGALSAVRALVEELTRHERVVRTTTRGHYSVVISSPLLDGTNSELARGAIWATALAAQEWAVPALRACAAFCGAPDQGLGTARSDKLAKACAAALGALGSDEAIAALAWLQNSLRARPALKVIGTALSEIAARRGLSASELLELAVPSLGLDELGTKTQPMGDFVARLRLEPSGLRLWFETAAGRELASVPKAIKQSHGDALAGLRAEVKEAKKVLAVERARVESLMTTERTWAFGDWAKRYLRHPVTARFAATLLWDFDDGAKKHSLLPLDGQFVNVVGDIVPTPAGRVRAWHPVREQPEVISSWRALLVEREIRQPFKQVFREIYRLTPAEQQTSLYSNRFAAHILSYPRATGLFRARGWKAHALGYWDGGYEGKAVRDFPDAGYRAIFYYDLVEQGADEGYERPTLCSTDQVRFERLDGTEWERVTLDVVPPLVFSEAMRDVDLFVGVASIGADTTWFDRGVDRRFDEYWLTYSVSELTEAARSRRDVLQRLMPKTKIADRCTVAGRFLVVQGTMRTYKIHIGSGNVLMEPDNSYLCIVPERGLGTKEKLFLPFDEDGGLLSIIVSKAFLLAEDDKITDRAILHQLGLPWEEPRYQA